MSWITAFKVIPWNDLIASAPAVVRGAKKLWSLVGKNESALHPAPRTTTGPESRVDALEREVANLQEQAAKSAKLIAELANHSERLVEAVEILRLRTKVLTIAVLVLGICALVGAIAFLR